MDGSPEPLQPTTTPARPASTAPARAVTYAVVAALAALAVTRKPIPAPRPAAILVAGVSPAKSGTFPS